MTEERALTIRELSYLMPAMALAEAIERRNMVVQFVGAIMVDGRDYGKVPGSDKPTLLKPGAEKLTTFFGLTPRYQVVEKTEDWTGEAHGGEPFFYYWYRCQLWRGEKLIAEGDGSCNSWESKYRYRTGERKCPNCGKSTIIKGKAEYGGGWLCYGKKGGCGAKFKAGDQGIEAQQVGRVLNPDPADIANTVNKMAQKRSYIAATLPAVNASEFFTQDLEDLDIIEGHATIVQPEPDKRQQEIVTLGPDGERLVVTQTAQAARPLAPEAIRDAIRRKAKWHDGQRVQSEPITEKQIGLVVSLMADAVQQGGMTQTELDNRRHDILHYLVGVTSTKSLTKAEASALIDWLKNGSEGINQWARAECAGIIKAVLLETGQQELQL